MKAGRVVLLGERNPALVAHRPSRFSTRTSNSFRASRGAAAAGEKNKPPLEQPEAVAAKIRAALK